MRNIAAALALTCIVASSHAAGLVDVNGGWMSGNDYRQNNLPTKKAFVAGLVSGYYYVPVSGAPTTRVDKLALCTSPTFASSALFGGGAEAEYGLGD